MMKRLIVKAMWTCAIVAMSVGCSTTVTRDELNRSVERSRANTIPKDLYYMGSDSNYDYYVARWGNDYDNQRVLIAGNEQADRMPYTHDSTKWRQVASLGEWVVK